MSYTNGLDKPTDYFNTKLYTGTGSTHNITGVGFQPDWTWIKSRSNAYEHKVYDSVRGATKELKSDNTNAESTDVNGLTSFDSDGFTLGTTLGVNGSSSTFASWNWLAGGTASSNTDGSITSTVSANTTAGFSIVSYTGTGSNATVGHGLSAVPRMIIVKNRDGVDSWVVQHGSLGAGKALNLDSSGAVQTYDPYWNGTEPTTSVFSIGTDGRTNGSSENFIGYCFAEKKGFSKAFSYTGNGNSDGVYIHLGMKPAWIMVKRTDAVNQWMIIDNKRTPSNTGTVPELFADLSDVENNSTDGRFDYLSNGLKARGTNAVINASGGSYIGFAFAESPFVTSGGIPCTAR